jgi:hypothetical protein
MPAKYTISLDGKWELYDWHNFAHSYTQVYALLYSLEFGKLPPVSDDFFGIEIVGPYRSYPWQGGYSALNFYRDLYWSLPEDHRPKVIAINYASPGWMELTLVPAIARSIETIVKSIANSIDTIDATYDRIHNRAQKRKLLRASVRQKERELSLDDIRFLRESAEELAKLMGFESLQKLHEHTGNPLTSFKILLSFYRRTRPLAEYQAKRLIKL